MKNTPVNQRLLLVDDDPINRPLYGRFLRNCGYAVMEASNGSDGVTIALKEKPDLILLDLEMPALNGLQVVDQLRAGGFRQPILMLTGHDDIDHRLAGLGRGADDFVCKACDPRELLARVHALLRRSQPPSATSVSQVRLGNVVIDLEQKQLLRDGEAVPLTRTEYSVLALLAQNAGKPVARETMLAEIWGYTHASQTRTLDTHIWRLRKKIGDNGDQPRWIVHRPGAGYLLCPDQTPSDSLVYI